MSTPERSLAAFRWISLALWLGLIAATVFTSPPGDPNTNTLILKMLRWKLEGVNLSLLGLFDFMGILSLVFIVQLAFDSTEQKVWRWPFLLGAIAGGSFVLLPYLVLRRWGAPRRPPDRRWLRVLGSRGVALGLMVSAAFWACVFFFSGGLEGYLVLFRTTAFAYAMTLDFFTCTLALGLLAIEDRRLRPESPSPLWAALGSGLGAAFRLTVSPFRR